MWHVDVDAGKKQGRRMPGIGNCLKILLTHSQCCPPLHCPLPPRRQSAETYKKLPSLELNNGSNLGGDERCGDTEVEGEEQGEDSEQGVQVQHGHHLILAQAGLPVE